MVLDYDVTGLLLPDEKRSAMRAVVEACERAGVDVPFQVERYFEENPEEPDRFIDLSFACFEQYDKRYDSVRSVTIDLSQIPENVQAIVVAYPH